ncbi:MAG: BlaI/MecI/CopY family transcriptional regulator [Pseudomonadales bacterium]|nr:BlaI/MecI/CopY family transcriptional regulator [Pseudomonadales bacterium]
MLGARGASGAWRGPRRDLLDGEDHHRPAGAQRAGRTIFYKAAISPGEVQESMLERFVTHVFAGDRRPMWNFLLRDEKLSPEENRYLEDLLARRQRRQEEYDDD